MGQVKRANAEVQAAARDVNAARSVLPSLPWQDSASLSSATAGVFQVCVCCLPGACMCLCVCVRVCFHACVQRRWVQQTTRSPPHNAPPPPPHPSTSPIHPPTTTLQNMIFGGVVSTMAQNAMLRKGMQEIQ